MAEDTSDWPGEREPLQPLEVERAHEIAEPTVQLEFKRALLATGAAYAYQQIPAVVLDDDLLHSANFDLIDDVDDDTDQSEYPYPLSYLLELPQIPAQDAINHYKDAFLLLSQQHVYLRDIITSTQVEQVSPPPYLEPSFACLGSCMTTATSAFSSPTEPPGGSSSMSAALYETARVFWSITLESDNRETRKSDAIIASLLMMTYAFSCAEESTWIQATAFMGYTGVIVRRLHITDYGAHPDGQKRLMAGLDWQNINLSALMSYMFLLDVVGSLHINASHQFCTNELFFKMPTSDHNFGEVYGQFLLDEKSLPIDIVADDDALLILVALCADVTATQRTYEESHPHQTRSKVSGPAQTLARSTAGHMPNSLLPFSSASEHQRVLSQLRRASDHWSERFKDSVPASIRALYHFVTICASWSTTLLLPHELGYSTATTSATPTMFQSTSMVVPPDEALRHAWLVLDNVNVRELESATACPIWLPVVTYISSLVIWMSLQPLSATQSKIGSLRVLRMFQAELEQMFWPCCTEMARHLNNVMNQ